MHRKIFCLITFILIPLLSVRAQGIWSMQIDSSTFFNGEICFIANNFSNSTLEASLYISTTNDTNYWEGVQGVGQPIDTLEYVFCPQNLTLGTSWWGWFDRSCRFFVSDLDFVTVPAGVFLSYTIIITDSLTGAYYGNWYLSNDTGLISWEQVNGDTTTCVLQSYTIIGGNGVFPLAVGNRWDMIGGSLPVSRHNQNPAPEGFTLYPNFPNPFNSGTEITFYLPRADYTTLIIIDGQGREIIRLADGWLGPGRYNIPFNAAELASGIYYACLNTGEWQNTLKLLHLK